MTDDIDAELDDVENSLAEKATAIIDEDTDWVTLAHELDVSRYQYGDSHPDWTTGTPFRPMFLAFLWSEVEDEPLGTLRTRLEDDAELAEAFGFDPDDLPSEATFRPCRVTDRFDTLQRTVEDAAETIRDVSAQRSAPIGYALGKVETDEEDSKPSNRTVQRLLRKKGREVLDEIKEVAIPSISLPRPDDPVYDKEELLTLEAIAAIDQAAANGSGETMGDMKNPDPDVDNDPFYEDGPTGETLLEAIKEMSVDQIATVMNFALRKTYTRAKPKLNEIDNLARSVFTSIDVTYVGYRGDIDELEWIQGIPDKFDEEKSYDWCYKFATITVVGDNTHYVLGVLPLGNADYADNDAYPGEEDQSHYKGDIVRKLLDIASEFVDIRMVYADREFHAADVFYTLQKHDVFYVVPAQRDREIQRKCNRFDQLKNGYEDEDRDAALHVEDYTFYSTVKHKTSNTRVETTLVMLPPDDDDDTHEDASPQPFFTNLPVSDEVSLDRRRARRKIERYSDRAAIENAYSSIKECAAWTTSKEFEVRWFHFAFGCIVYNLWLLTDFLTQARIGVIETRTKPRIKLKRFLRWLDDQVITLI